jgi:hypothetical protein
MARSKSTTDVETPVETDTPAATPEGSAEKPAKAKKEPARGDLPEGYVTPVGFAKILGEKGLQKNREGEVVKDVKPQMVYSYIKNAPKDDPFPLENVKDSLDKERQVVKTEAGITWWERKNKRTEERKANAKAKADKTAANKANKEKAAQEAEASEPAVEAEAE